MTNYLGLLENGNSLKNGYNVNNVPFIRYFSRLILQGHHERSIAQDFGNKNLN